MYASSTFFFVFCGCEEFVWGGRTNLPSRFTLLAMTNAPVGTCSELRLCAKILIPIYIKTNNQFARSFCVENALVNFRFESKQITNPSGDLALNCASFKIHSAESKQMTYLSAKSAFEIALVNLCSESNKIQITNSRGHLALKCASINNCSASKQWRKLSFKTIL